MKRSQKPYLQERISDEAIKKVYLGTGHTHTKKSYLMVVTIATCLAIGTALVFFAETKESITSKILGFSGIGWWLIILFHPKKVGGSMQSITHQKWFGFLMFSAPKPITKQTPAIVLYGFGWLLLILVFIIVLTAH